MRVCVPQSTLGPLLLHWPGAGAGEPNPPVWQCAGELLRHSTATRAAMPAPQCCHPYGCLSLAPGIGASAAPIARLSLLSSDRTASPVESRLPTSSPGADLPNSGAPGASANARLQLQPSQNWLYRIRSQAVLRDSVHGALLTLTTARTIP